MTHHSISVSLILCNLPEKIYQKWDKNVRLSYKEYLLLKEGIVKVDDKILKLCHSYFIVNSYEEVIKLLDLRGEEVTKLDSYVDMAKNFLFKNRDIFSIEDGKLKVAYESSYGFSEYFYLDVLSINRREIGASFKKSNDTILVYYNNFAFVNLLEVWEDKKDYRYFLGAYDTKRDDIEHELAHFIEFKIEQSKNISPKSRNKDYEKLSNEYMMSDLELEQQAINLIRKFELIIRTFAPIKQEHAVEIINILLGKPRNNRIELDQVVSGNLSNNFMLSLRDSNNRSYRKILNKCYIEMKNSIPNLKKEGFII